MEVGGCVVDARRARGRRGQARLGLLALVSVLVSLIPSAQADEIAFSQQVDAIASGLGNVSPSHSIDVASPVDVQFCIANRCVNPYCYGIGWRGRLTVDMNHGGVFIGAGASIRPWPGPYAGVLYPFC
jgi:hypothetical protein